jgi:chemotaxis protein methyltransferase CheR
MAAQPAHASQSLEDIEMSLLLEGIALHYGFDFRDYTQSTVRRNILMSMAVEGVPTISSYQEKVLHDARCMERFLDAVGVNVTSMFREAASLLFFREEIVPWLRTFPSVRIWVAGCGTGEDVLSLAILLNEAGVLPRTRIYATDINERSLMIARTARHPVENVAASQGDYVRSGGQRSLSDYYSIVGDIASFDRNLIDNVTWARHSLIADASFNSFHAIYCTNVLTYFSRSLQDRVLRLLGDSLVDTGFLVLGRLESMVDRPRGGGFARVRDRVGVYRKGRP